MRAGTAPRPVAPSCALIFGVVFLPIGRCDLAECGTLDITQHVEEDNDAHVSFLHYGFHLNNGVDVPPNRSELGLLDKMNDEFQSGKAAEVVEKNWSSLKDASDTLQESQDDVPNVLIFLILGLILCLPVCCLVGASLVRCSTDPERKEDVGRSDTEQVIAMSDTLSDYWAGFVACVRSSDLPSEKQLVVITYMREASASRSWELQNRFHGQLIHVVQALIGAMVPILIPVSQTYAEDYINSRVSYGQIVALFAVVLSLLGSVFQLLDRILSKSEEMGVNGRRSMALKHELAQYITMCGEYHTEEASLSQKYVKFTGRASNIMLKGFQEELKVYADSIEASVEGDTKDQQDDQSSADPKQSTSPSLAVEHTPTKNVRHKLMDRAR